MPGDSLSRFSLTKRKRLVYDTNRLILTRINRARFPTVTMLLCTREETLRSMFVYERAIIGGAEIYA